MFLNERKMKYIMVRGIHYSSFVNLLIYSYIRQAHIEFLLGIRPNTDQFLESSISWIKLIFTDYFNQQQQNTPSTQAHM